MCLIVNWWASDDGKLRQIRCRGGELWSQEGRSVPIRGLCGEEEHGRSGEWHHCAGSPGGQEGLQWPSTRPGYLCSLSLIPFLLHEFDFADQ